MIYYFIKILLNKKCSHKFKECVIDFIYSVVENHKKVLQKNQDLLKKLVRKNIYIIL